MIRIAITTYNRPVMLTRLVEALQAEELHHGVNIHAYDDGSDEEPPYLKDCTVHRFEHGGKQGFNRILNAILDDARRDFVWKYLIILPDDVEPVDNFLARAVALWEAINDRKKMALGLLTDEERRGKPNWTGFKPYIVDLDDGQRVYHSQWTEHALICERTFVQILPDMGRRNELVWIKNPERGSGVGAHISCTIHRKNYNIYQAHETLLHHGDHESLMHPETRKRERLTTR